MGLDVGERRVSAMNLHDLKASVSIIFVCVTSDLVSTASVRPLQPVPQWIYFVEPSVYWVDCSHRRDENGLRTL